MIALILLFSFISLSSQAEIVVYPTNSTWLQILTSAKSAGTTVTFRAGTYATSSAMSLALNGALGNVRKREKKSVEDIIFYDIYLLLFFLKKKPMNLILNGVEFYFL